MSRTGNNVMNGVRLLGFGVFIHIIFLLSIFDIYFKSPIISGILPENNNVLPPGKRVVLISVDGLRLDSVFDVDPVTGKYVAEYLQDVIENRGTWGVSQTRVPTESRPGHVAMLAGFYEDPSAVTRGWKENPVDFDSVFNRSYCSFAWGSPDILNIFFKGLSHSCARMDSYENEQNFAGDTKQYDDWVYDKVEKFMRTSKADILYQEGIFFFLHLLGQDTSGHTDKPHTVKYRENLKNVDAILKKTENLFYEFYGDDKTSFIVTSDHGMTNWGSHGAGDFDELNTPIVAWGAGIKSPSSPSKQINISQADITPLLAVLLGASIPVNSVGVLPIAFLNMSRKQIAEATKLNAQQMVSQYLKALANTKQQTISWFYKPFNRLHPPDIELRFSLINQFLNKEKYTDAIKESKALIEVSLEGLDYYQNYYQTLLLLCITLSYLGWMTYLLLALINDKGQHQHSFNLNTLNLAFICILVITVLLIGMQNLPFSYSAYILLPEFLWYSVLKKASLLLSSLRDIDKSKFSSVTLLTLAGIEILVMSFFHRWILSISLGIILIWTMSAGRPNSNQVIRVVWTLSGVALALFSLLPTIGSQPNPVMTASSGACLCFLSIILLPKSLPAFLRIVTLTLSVWNNYFVHSYFNQNQILLGVNQSLSWGLSFLGVSLLFWGGSTVLERFLNIFISLCVPFVLLSVTHELFFIVLLFVHLLCWIFVEKSFRRVHCTLSQFRIAYYFLTYVFVSFFGLGNISNLNSFDPAWVRCFITVFSPFLMSTLIIFKTLIPFLLVTCTVRIVTDILSIPPQRLFVIVLLFSNIMALNFLFLIKNKGSWLDIGLSISHYVIQQVTIVFLALLFGIADFLTKFRTHKKTDFDFFQTFDKINLLPTFYKRLTKRKI